MAHLRFDLAALHCQPDGVGADCPAHGGYRSRGGWQRQRQRRNLPVPRHGVENRIPRFHARVRPGEAQKDEAENNNGEEVDNLPPLTAGEDLDAVEWLNDRKETQPPPRFPEASLVKILEENGVGRPSTYAQIISTLLGPQVCEPRKRTLVPTELGSRCLIF